MAIQILILAFLLTFCAARVYQRDERVIRVPLSRYVPANISIIQKRQHETPLPQFEGEIYYIQGILCHWNFIVGISGPDTL